MDGVFGFLALASVFGFVRGLKHYCECQKREGICFATQLVSSHIKSQCLLVFLFHHSAQRSPAVPPPRFSHMDHCD